MADQRHAESRGRSRIPRVKKSGDGDPKMIGQWKVGRTIGKGSSGRVKIARHVKTHQYAAIKIVSKNALLHSRMSMSDAPAQAEKVLLGIEREIVIMKLIDHPNVLNLYDVWETGNELYLIMEYVEGGELFDYLVSRGRLPVNEALHFFQQIISAISYCHGFNIAHRDLKPENLLLSKSSSGPNIKVADFGMAAYTDPAAMLSTSCGSPHYASPEVIEGRAYKGNVSDIWSCGVILYALLAGRLPFDDENLRTLLEKVKMASYAMPVDIPPAAQNLIARMLEKDVTQRITMSQVLKHPFFLTSSPSPSRLLDAQTPTLGQLSSSMVKPVQFEEDIDADIFDNLRTLWHGAPAQDIIENLLNDEKTWEKAVYHLLLKYRSRHLENYNMDEDDGERERSCQRQDEIIQVIPSPDAVLETESVVEGPKYVEGPEDVKEPLIYAVTQDEAEDPVPAYVARPSAPTPQRAVWNGNIMTLDSDPAVFISTPHHVHRVTSPVAPQRPPLPASDTDMDAFTSTPHRGPSIRSPGPIPLPLPILRAPFVLEEHTLSVISLHDARHEEILAHDRTSPHAQPSSASPTPMPELPPLDIPNLQDVDETVQRFFHQIVEHLNIMQIRQAQSSTASSQSATPDPGYNDTLAAMNHALRPSPGAAANAIRERNDPPPPPPTTPAFSGTKLDSHDSRFEDAEEDLGVSADPPVLGLGISEFHGNRSASRPPLQQRQQSARLQPPPGRAYLNVSNGAPKKSFRSDKRSRAGDKENADVRKEEAGIDGVQVRKKSSLRNSEGGRKNLGNKHVQIVLPPEEAEHTALKQRKSILSTSSAETSPALSDGSSFFLTADSKRRRSWFGNLFNFKPASHNLLSVHDAYTTREECARLLRALGVTVVLTNSEGNGVLKCKLEEVRDPAGVMAVAKAVRFRVELHAVTYAHSVSGYVSSLTMVQEKGALSSFKLVYNRLRREWDLDTPPSTRTPASVYGSLGTSPGFVPGIFSGAAYAVS